MITELSSRIEWINVDKAKELFEFVDEKHQRQLARRHWTKLSAIMSAGGFRTGNIAVVHVQFEGGSVQTRIVNGQHTLKAIIHSGWSVKVLMQEYSCDGESEYVELFHSYDTENKNRSYHDCANIFLMEGSLGQECTARELKRFRSALSLYDTLMNGKKQKFTPKTKHQQYELVKDYLEELAFFRKIYAIKQHDRFFSRIGVVAAAIWSYRKDSANAIKFWSRVVSGFFYEDDGNRHAPAVQLHKKIQEWGDSYGKKTRPPTPTEVFYACARTFDAFLDGRNVVNIRMSEPSTKKSRQVYALK